MKCKICGATCRCRRAGPGICCDCHPHKAAAKKLSERIGPPWELTEKEMLELFALEHGHTTIDLFAGTDTTKGVSRGAGD